jgi:ATP-dependent RNA helicase SUPV3L1/SUV3
MSTETPNTFALPDHAAEEYVEHVGGEIAKQDGRVVIRICGSVEVSQATYKYDLVPSHGVLAKAGKWRNLKPAEKMKLVMERINLEIISELHTQAHKFVQDFMSRALAEGLHPEPFLASLSDVSSSDPVELVFQRIERRFANALEKHHEVQRAERTRESVNLGEYPDSFDIARRIPRKFVAILGPTNSSKTHEAMHALSKAKSGAYLAPLRLLALENYERLVAQLSPHGGKVSLITGEEQRIEEGATHVASTVEMLDFRSRVDVVVIDEIQMLADRDRGAAWTAAVCGAPASTVYLVGALEARAAIEALAERLDVPLEVKVTRRKGPLEMEATPIRKVKNLKKGDAVIVFSRRDVLLWRDLVTEAGLSVSTVYGNLSPESRRAQAERFREGKTDIVVSTDAISMGLNLPIERVVFTTATKFNGIEEEEISPALARQIAGRAGRYGIHEAGYVAGFDDDTHHVIKEILREKVAPLSTKGFFVSPSLEHLSRISKATGESALTKLLQRFARNVDTADGFFVPSITEDQLERAAWLDTLPMSLEDKFTLSLVPVSSRVDSINYVWEQWARNMSRGTANELDGTSNNTRLTLQEAEDMCKLCSAYAWLAYRRPEHFPCIDKALEIVRDASIRVDQILAAQNKARRKPGGDRRQRRFKIEDTSA